MIELTTGAVFLMSSLYGSGQAGAQASQPIAPVQDVQVATTTTSSSLTTSQAAIKSYLEKQFADEPILVDIASCESNFHQFDSSGNVVRGIVNNADVGVMQINEKYHAAMAQKLGIDLYSIAGNVEYAKHLYHEQGSKPWASSQKCWGPKAEADGLAVK